jgi:hypothetical protein
MKQFRFVLDADPFLAFNKAKKSERAALLTVFCKLQKNPYLRPDLIFEAYPRDMNVLRCGKLLVFYWVDHFASEVRITQIKSADNR